MLAKYRFLLAIVVSFSAIYAQSAAALVGWRTTSNPAYCDSATGGNCSSEYTDSKTFIGDGGRLMTATAWANTTGNANTLLQAADLAQYGGGLGVRNADSSSSPKHVSGEAHDANEGNVPEHAMDNNERFDMILFDFQDVQFSLEQVTVGWYQTDSDISVLAYTGNVAFDPASLVNRTTGGSEDLTSNGWEIVGNYDVDSIDPNGGLPQTAAINPTQVSSSYWLIGAYNPVFSAAGCTGGCWAGNDYLKIADLVGTIVNIPPPPTSVPEPGSLLLLASALFIAPGLRRRRNKNMQAQ